MDAQSCLFQLYKNSNIEEGISENFIEIMKKCSSPNFILFYGERTVEKTSLMNQIINGIISKEYFNLKEPFTIPKLNGENKSYGSYIYGPIKISDLAKVNNIEENKISKDIINNEIFFVDISDLKKCYQINKSIIFEILIIFLISSQKLIYLSNNDYEKLEEISKIKNISKIFNLKNIVEESQIFTLFKDINLKEKEENKLIKELETKKNIFEKKINEYILEKDNTKILCQNLPSYELAMNEVESYPTCFKSQMKNLIVSILSNIKYMKEINGEKILDLINKNLSIIKTININCGNIQKSTKILNNILIELFREKINKNYFGIIEKINKFDKNIFCLNGKIDLIKRFLNDEIKNELNDNYEIYEKYISNEIANILEIYSLKLEIMIKENIYRVKNQINEEINVVNDINKNQKILEYISKIHYKEEINVNEIKNIIEEDIKSLLTKHSSFFECIESTDKEYKSKILDNAKKYISNNINDITFQKPNWKDILNKYILYIDTNIINIYKNNLVELKSIRDIEREIKNNFVKLKKEIEEYTENNKFYIYNKEDYLNSLEDLFTKLKKELDFHLIFLKEQNEKIIQKTIPNGIYKIIPKLLENKVLEINNNENYSNIQIGESNNNLSQHFEIKYSPILQFYTIKNINSNKFLTVDYNNNNNIIQFKKHYGNNQQWHIVSVGDNYEIISELNGYCMDISENNNNLGTNISCKPKTGELGQQFELKIDIPSPDSKSGIETIQTKEKNLYFPKTSYTGCSIVEALNLLEINSSYQFRAEIAKKNKIEGYKGTPQQNLYMLKLLKEGLLIKP